MQLESFSLPTPIGFIEIYCCQEKISEINLGMDNRKTQQFDSNILNKSMSSFALMVKGQLEGYFSSATSILDLDVLVKGTAFQQSVWDVIKSIKVGETLTYTDVANKLNSSPRAVGNACRSNPVPIIVPCHRIVSKSGIGGFAGQRVGSNIDAKTWLLEHELASTRSIGSE